MIKCSKCQSDMVETLTKGTVLVDVCKSCKGIWLDQGEINFLCKSEKLLRNYHKNGLEQIRKTDLPCPRCASQKLQAGKLPDFPYTVEECPHCSGLFIELEELKKLNSSKYFKKMTLDRGKAPSSKKKSVSKIPSFKYGSLGFMSASIMISMYAMLFGFLIFFAELGYLNQKFVIPLQIGFVLLQFIVGPIIMDFSLRFFGSLEWVDVSDLPARYQADLRHLCKQNKLPLPKMGIIQDGSPQAFTYGRTPGSARVVISAGMFDLLTEDELETVLAHELGHVKHWDFVFMTMAQLVPIIFYQIYRMTTRTRSSSSKKSKGSHPGVLAAGVIAYLFYMLSSFLVKFLSRIREYHADKFSSDTTAKPNDLVKALAKIALGMASAEKTKDKATTKAAFKDKMAAVQAMNIMNISGSKELVIATNQLNGNEINPEMLKDIMRWDLWSPWAAYYEFYSTHPLPSKRINALSQLAEKRGLEPFVKFDLRRPESYWDEFWVDLGYLILPAILGLVFAYYASLTNPSYELIQIAIMFVRGFAIGSIVKLFRVYSYGRFNRYAISSLLKKVKVSPVRSIPVKVSGKVIGHGDAGNIFSEDMVLQDETGIIYLDHEPFGFNFLFALSKVTEFKGQDVVVTGWYRRSPVPYIEVKNISCGSSSSNAYSFHLKFGILVLVLIATFFIKSYLYK